MKKSSGEFLSHHSDLQLFCNLLDVLDNSGSCQTDHPSNIKLAAGEARRQHH